MGKPVLPPKLAIMETRLHAVASATTLHPSSCSAKRITSDTGSVPGDRMKIKGVVLT